jgi:hypothetical protein
LAALLQTSALAQDAQPMDIDAVDPRSPHHRNCWIGDLLSWAYIRALELTAVA